MDAQLERILKLVKKTGEKVVVIQDDSEFVIASLDEYMRLIEDHGQIAQLTESQMLDKINRDIALWREAQKEALSQPIINAPLEEGSLTKELNQAQLNTENVRYAPIDHQVQAEIDQLNEQIQAVYKEGLEAQNINLDYVSQSFKMDKPKPEINTQAKKAEQGVSYELPVSLNSTPSKIDKSPSVDQLDSPQQDSEIKRPTGFKFASFAAVKGSKKVNQNQTDKADKVRPKAKSRRINNFGYPNPEDTPLNEEQLNQQPSVDRRQQEHIPQPLEEENS